MARTLNTRALLLLSTVVFFGCQQPSRPSSTLHGPPTVQLKAEADALSERGDYEAAAVKYRGALNRDPDDVPLHFALGVAFSHLGRYGETVEQFRFVTARGHADAVEVRAARRWLIGVGELNEQAVALSIISESPEREASNEKTVPPHIKGAKVRVMFQPGLRGRDVNVVLAGDSDSNRELAFVKTIKLGESFEFESVPPGEYRLTAKDPEDDTQVLDRKVTVGHGKDLVLDVTR